MRKISLQKETFMSLQVELAHFYTFPAEQGEVHKRLKALKTTFYTRISSDWKVITSLLKNSCLRLHRIVIVQPTFF